MHKPSATGLLPHTDAALPWPADPVPATGGEVMSDAEFFDWLAGRQRKHAQQVRPIPFAELSGWDFARDTGNLQHRSGRFYSVQGLRVRSDGPVPEWTQPIICQPEIGILGLAVREINGVTHCLMQAKSEPGNLNGVQLSPTVQATKSNYSRVHGGSAVPYLDCFLRPDPRRHRVLADTLQSEQGSWFHRKRNRNMVVEVGPEVEAGEDFCWLSLRQVNSFLRVEDLLNMDTRTVLSCMPDRLHGAGTAVASGGGSRRGLHSDTEIRSWITGRRSEREVSATLLPLREVEGRGWHRWDDRISHERGLFFSIIAVDVSSSRREVPAWSQPLLQPHGIGVLALLVKRFDGVLHALVRAHAEPGHLDVVELAPTVQCTPENYAHLPAEHQPRFLDVVRESGPERTLFDTVLSEEGGRFHHARNRYLIIEVDEDFPTTTTEDYRWMTLGQLTGLLEHSHYLNVQARTLVAAMRTLPEAGDADADHR
ncbi:NDP-hexose 2,3-dehydratase family protein [Wenjunlia tyrosinilytica]|uniref:NDP-hexose 2,3-dehydratase n=1 Tax=Wenjunlia tyrosinilytica TaxID=1544741 RepID=A0A918E1H8_9ACTN|nr:NDP-hexose 2,3-dehydratase family protein [Wenjunlia tyrosinilytica]GGO97767.1 NDP-hexose 2,3-dehydratase [Wenjunlia tyrosinilytica]